MTKTSSYNLCQTHPNQFPDANTSDFTISHATRTIGHLIKAHHYDLANLLSSEMPSKPSLTLEQKAKIISALPSSSNKILTAVPARIYFAHPQRRDKWSYGGLQGALAFTYEKSKDAFVLKLVDFAGTGGVIWQHELNAQFEYHKDQPLLHSFAGDVSSSFDQRTMTQAYTFPRTA